MNAADNKYGENTLMIIAGEVSGDLIGASLIYEMKKLNPGISFCGIGGDKMEEAGMDIIYHINRMAFLGFSEIVKHIPFIKKVQTDLLSTLLKRNIRKLVLIDYPGFNLNFAKKIKKTGIKIIYYVSPQVWAWGRGRMKKIKSLVDKMLVVFPFEEKLYKENNVDVQFVGHPIAERVEQYRFYSSHELYEKYDLDEKKEILLLMPGSRKNEVVKLFPQMIEAADKLADRFNLQVVVACSSNIDKKIFLEINEKIKYKVIEDHSYDLMKHAKFGIIKSGTSTLEAAYFALPMLIVYKTSSLTYLIGSRLIKVENIGMANIILGEKVVPELLQKDVTADKIFEYGFKILKDTKNYQLVKSKLSRVKTKLGQTGVSARAAKIICEIEDEN